MRHFEARKILEAYCLQEDGKPASTGKRSHKAMNKASGDPEWWLANTVHTPKPDNPRTKAYFRAYVEIAGPRFFATGIPLEDGYMQPDRGCMKSLFEAGAVEIQAGRFVLTECGQELIADVAPLEDGEQGGEHGA